MYKALRYLGWPVLCGLLVAALIMQRYPQWLGLPAQPPLFEAAQAPEIETMTGWLEEWGEEVPDTSMMGMDHSGMDGMEGMDMDMPGMMSSEEMAELDAATGAAFETMWLEMMIEHHEGAIEMAQAEQEDGEYAPAIALAEEIEAAQTEEIAVMEELLAR